MANYSGGTIVWDLSVNTSKFDSQIASAKGNISSIGDVSDKTSRAANKSFDTIGTIGLAGIAAASVAAGAMIVKNIGGAISRVDTLNNFPKVMSNLGFGADQSKAALDKLDKAVRGLPTSLDSIAGALQNIAPASSSLSRATDLTIAFNNALIAGGKSADLQSTAMEQFSQAVAKGKPDMIEWRSIATAMPGQLKQIANSLGFEQWQQMADAVSNGKLSFDDVQTAIINLNQKGLGDFPSFADQAKNSAGGLQTGIANMNTAITRGIADVIQSIGSGDISTTLGNIGKSFEDALKSVSGLIKFVKANKDWIAPIAIAVGGFAGAILTLASAYKVYTIAVNIAKAAQLALNFVFGGSPIGLIITAIAAVVVALVYFFTQTETGRKVFAAFMAFIGTVWKTISGLFTAGWNGIKAGWDFIAGVFNGIINFFKTWGLTILAVLFWPFSLAIGLIIQYWQPISGFFGAIWNGIVAVFSVVVGFFAGVFQAAWDAIVFIWNIVVAYYTAIWNGIVAVFTPVIGFFAGIFGAAWNAIKAVFGAVGGFFAGVWNTIVGVFGGIGTAVGNAIGGAFKNVINSVLNFAVNVINGFIDSINWAIGVINNIPGVHIGKLGRLGVPQLADGGIVTRPTLAMIGEGGQSEAVIPLSKLDKIVGGGNITINMDMSGIVARSRADWRDIMKDGIIAINEELKSKGLPEIGGGSLSGGSVTL